MAVAMRQLQTERAACTGVIWKGDIEEQIDEKPE
jgi:hypothetical protein